MPAADLSPPLQAVAITLIVVTVTSFCLRAYVRTCMVRAFGMDDWFMLAAAISYILFATVVLLGVHYGTGRKSTDLTAENYSRAMQVSSWRRLQMRGTVPLGIILQYTN